MSHVWYATRRQHMMGQNSNEFESRIEKNDSIEINDDSIRRTKLKTLGLNSLLLISFTTVFQFTIIFILIWHSVVPVIGMQIATFVFIIAPALVLNGITFHRIRRVTRSTADFQVKVGSLIEIYTVKPCNNEFQGTNKLPLLLVPVQRGLTLCIEIL